MHTNEPREDPLVEMGYEIRDIDFKKVKFAAVCFFSFAGLSALCGWVIYANRFAFFGIARPEPTASAMVRPLPAPINPLLQDNITSKIDISILRQQETKRMTSTGYNDDKTTVHIPIERAMDLIAQRGLPKTETIPAVSKGNTMGQVNPPTPAGMNPASTAPAGAAPNSIGGSPAGSNPIGGAPSSTPPASTKPTAPPTHGVVGTLGQPPAGAPKPGDATVVR